MQTRLTSKRKKALEDSMTSNNRMVKEQKKEEICLIALLRDGDVINYMIAKYFNIITVLPLTHLKIFHDRSSVKELMFLRKRYETITDRDIPPSYISSYWREVIEDAGRNTSSLNLVYWIYNNYKKNYRDNFILHRAAIHVNNMEMLQWSFEIARLYSITKSCYTKYQFKSLMMQAAEEGSFEMIEFLKKESLDKVSYRKECLFVCAAMGNNRKVAEKLRELKCPFGSRVTKAAVIGNHTDMFLWLVKEGCPYKSGDIAIEAAKNNNLDLYKWCWERFPMTCSMSIGYLVHPDRKKILRWVVEEGGYNDNNCRLSNLAALDGNLEMLKFLVEDLRLGVDWNRIMTAAAVNDDPKMLDYAKEKGCPDYVMDDLCNHGGCSDGLLIWLQRKGHCKCKKHLDRVRQWMEIEGYRYDHIIMYDMDGNVLK